MRSGLNLCGLSDRVLRLQSTLGVNQVRRENSVDERRLSETSLPYIFRLSRHGSTRSTALRRTNDDDIELETTLQELVLDLLRDRVETDVGSSTNFLFCSGGHFNESSFERRGKVEEEAKGAKFSATTRRGRTEFKCGAKFVCLFTLTSGSFT
jgi:hypothetical protein